MSDRTGAEARHTPLRIVFMGTSSFAVPALEALYRGGSEPEAGGSNAHGRDGAARPGVCPHIVYVVTQPDRARGRGGKVQPTPVGLFAEENNLKLLKPENLKTDEGFLDTLAEACPDLIVVAAYGKILPKAVLGLPPLGCVNIHASLLPEYRGAAPVQRAILDGKQEVGVTLMHMAEGLDTGDMIAFSKTDAGKMNAGEMTDRLSHMGAALLMDMLPGLIDGTAPRLPQDGANATYAEKIEKEEGRIDIGGSAEEAALKVRAMTPAPGAYVIKGGERIVVTAAQALKTGESMMIAPSCGGATPGMAVAARKNGIYVKTGDGILVIETLKAPYKKEMPAWEYLKGNTFEKVE